jgi:putative transposase
MDIFLDTMDFGGFRALLSSVVERFSWSCLAYCLMPNHYHLVLETPRVLLSRGMHRLNFLYAQGFNARYERQGHVFQNRFGARLIDHQDYLGDACTYVWMNPVRAGLCRAPEDWPWSGGSYGSTMDPLSRL